ncbi:MAG: ubiquinone/menaquinone biosynthesis C-methylase UbiE [Clostridium sp.]|jgi:ubiquinone/menaquinone biosynthesis C-methylase UbiE
MKKNIGRAEILEYRRHMLENASGSILEIGIGTGLNLNLYPDDITEITAIDPLVRKLPISKISVKLYPDSAEKLHFEDNTFDTVVSTFTLCSIPNIDIALAEIARVLKPNGQFIFLEHGRATSEFIRSIQVLANPFFNLLAYGCNITRNYEEALNNAGFILNKYKIYRASIFPKEIAGYLHEGVAKK